ncbi:MAG: Swt1 family HEPN domain-containing protein [archaeon]
MKKPKNENRVETEIIKSLQTKLKISKRAVDLKIEKLRKDRGYDITRRDTALLLASLNFIDISKFADSDKLKEIRNLKDKNYKVEVKKGKTIEKDRILKIKDVIIKSRDPFIPKKLISDAREMCHYYSLLYVLENVLRNLIRHVYKDEPEYFNKKIPDKVRKDILSIKAKEKYYQEERDDELEYAHLDFLKQIITSDWTNFSQIIKENDKNKFIHEIEKFMPERHSIAHTTRLKGIDESRTKYKVEEILKMI